MPCIRLLEEVEIGASNDTLAIENLIMDFISGIVGSLVTGTANHDLSEPEYIFPSLY